jgi:hypothetical protein
MEGRDDSRLAGCQVRMSWVVSGNENPAVGVSVRARIRMTSGTCHVQGFPLLDAEMLSEPIDLS